MNTPRFFKETINFAFLKKAPVEETGVSGVQTFNYRLLWTIVIVMTNLAALLPLITITIADYTATERAFETEHKLRTAQVVSNVHHSLAFLIVERQSAMRFVAASLSAEELEKPGRLAELLNTLRESFGSGFEDIGIINAEGIQNKYEGPHKLTGIDYSGQPWFDKVVQEGAYVSDVFLGFRQEPHLAIAVKKDLSNGLFQIIRTTMSIEPLDRLLADTLITGGGDALIVNSAGVLQNNSRYHGPVLSPSPLPVPAYHTYTSVIETRDSAGETLLVGYRFVDKTPFILMVVKEKKELMKGWYQTRKYLILFFIGSVCAIFLITAGSATILVRKVYIADKRRLMSVHQVEYAAKMASIGRLAASVSHEINNPLAIINEKAGLMKDLIEIKKTYAKDPKFLGMVDSILEAVQRAARITRRLLSFAGDMEAGSDLVNMKLLIKQVIGFLEKEAQLKLISIRLEAANEIPSIKSDRGKLQQIFVNIINNAFEAMESKGQLTIEIDQGSDNNLSVKVCDNGPGIPHQDLQHIFEPFFSTKTGRGGTGLGLSVTYNLVHEIGGRISVDSEEGVGTCFTVTLPLKPAKTEESPHARVTGG